MGQSDSSSSASQPLRSDAERRAGYWSRAELALYLGVSPWTVTRRVKADPAFPVLRGFGPDRYPIERVKAYLQRLEQGRGRAHRKSADLLHLEANGRTNSGTAQPERAS
jgi:hypothetical protein